MVSAIEVVEAEKSDKIFDDKTVLGFWIYLMSDCFIFAVLFATYVINQNSTMGGFSSTDLFHPERIALSTGALLTSSLTVGLAMISLRASKQWLCTILLIVTALLGVVFLTLEISEFSEMVSAGAVPQASAYLSSFFALVGMHGLHVSIGLLWLSVIVFQLCALGPKPHVVKGLVCFTLFWHFLDLIWIWIFTLVYLSGSA